MSSSTPDHTPDRTSDDTADGTAAAQHLTTTTRRIDTVGDAGPGAEDLTAVRLLVLARTYAAEAGEVWSAISTAEGLARWFLPVQGDLEEGGRFALEGSASGEVLACVEAERISLTWEDEGASSTVDLSLRPVPEGTVLQLDHRDPLTEQQWAEHGPGAVGIGWELAMLSLAAHLAGGTSPAPADLGEVVSAAAAGWAEAAMADGDDEDDARAAATRCLAAYAED